MANDGTIVERPWTPGPWMATERSGYHEILARDESSDWYGRENMHAVAYVDTEVEEPEAHARLIAAAPALYEALEKIAAIDFASAPWQAVEHEVKEAARAALRLVEKKL